MHIHIYIYIHIWVKMFWEIKILTFGKLCAGMHVTAFSENLDI